MLLILLPALLLLLVPNAKATDNTTLAYVECPDDVQTFTALTEMVFEGRSGPPSDAEETVLRLGLRNVYNTISEENCDSFFRRISNLTMIGMSGMAGGMEMDSNITSVNRMGGMGRLLQQNFTVGTINTTDDVSLVRMSYEVVGTCRGCALTQAGSFDLYDEAFRRLLRGRTLVEERSTRQLTDEEDCQCVNGALPLEPQAPGVRECVDAMNSRFENLEDQQGLFEDLRLADLRQLDLGVHDDNNATTVAAPTTVAVTNAPTMEPTTPSKNIWS